MNLIVFEKEKFDDLIAKIDQIIEKLDQDFNATEFSDNWLTTKEVAQVLKVTTRTIHNYQTRGEIPYSKKNGILRFRALDIQQWLMDDHKKPHDWKGDAA